MAAGPGNGAMVVIGAGECGLRAAMALRDAGFPGTVTLIGAERHLPYERPPLSKDAMGGAGEPEMRTVATAAALAEARIDFVSHNPAVALDTDAHRVRLADGRELSYDRLLLATGAVPRRLPGQDAHPHLVALRTFEDALAIRAALHPGSRILVIGGGFIGLELAAAARRLGAAVTLVEAQTRILTRGVPAAIAAVLHEKHAENGVDILCGVAIAGIESTAEELRITLADGRVIAADLGIVGIGAVPSTALAQAAGLAVANGVEVDGRLATSAPDVFAAGDCCAFPLALYGGRRVRLEAWRNAQEQGALAAVNMLGGDGTHAFVPWFWSDQYDLGLQIAGLHDEGEAIVRRDLASSAFILFHLAGDGRLVAASGIGPGTAVARDIRLAEMLIARRARPTSGELSSPDVKLKSLLAA